MSDKDTFFLVAKTLHGLEEVLADELSALGASAIDIQKRAVSFTGDKALIYKSNLCLRTALNVMKHISSFNAVNENELYHHCLQVEWEKYFNDQKTFSITYTVNSPYFKHSQYAALKLKDAIVDRFKKKFNTRPSVHKANPDIKINLHISHNKVNLSIDTSGDSLYRRGYKKINGQAPLSEVLAAGMILLSNWDKSTPFYDPMCGSGTLALEAALIAANIPAGICRKDYGFMYHADFDKELWQNIYTQAVDNMKHTAVDIYGSDILERNVGICIANALALKRYIRVNFYRHDFFSGKSKFSLPGIIIFNPPYGERLSEDDLITFYKRIGSTLKHFYKNNSAWILSSNIEAVKHIGLKANKKIQLINGQLACMYACFDMYEGSKKVKK